MSSAAGRFAGPYAAGVPAPALRIVAPSLTRFSWRELVRGAEIAVVLAWHLTGAAVRHLARRPSVLLRLRRNHTARAALASAVSVGLVEAFMALGPTFVKLGQLIASSPGMFPAPLADACLRTLDDVPPFPAGDALAIVEDDLGASAAQMFADFDPEPLSAASIAQVHACTLADGREAVLKIQRPSIRDRMNRDLRMMYRMAGLVDRTRTGHLMNAPGVVEDLHQVTNEELNFALEAHRQAEFRDQIGAFGDNRWITAPAVYWDHCGPRVICMERLRGTPMDRFAEIRARGIDGELVLRRGLKAWMEATLVHGPFHGDVHAGNIWVLDDGRAAYLDFGIMGELPDAHRQALRDAQYTVMIDGDYRRIVRAWQRIGILSEDVGPVDEVAARLKAVLDPMFDMTLGEVSLSFVLRRQLELQHEYGARAARELVLVSKQLMYFERYAKELAPDYNLARDLFLVQNVFPEAVARLAAERGISFPDDSIPHVLASAAGPAAAAGSG
ncbi:MAG TPA: AarF/UbiB family protein [Acidimicrobiales bacterium]|jgi:predicted unusual protein kinase regulating ubiquinone biosynthesis (AarF/ABC1/UbiB family)|nr:AarF/UbiB family protein [Acidimicrobiales bacterium]